MIRIIMILSPRDDHSDLPDLGILDLGEHLFIVIITVITFSA